MKARRIGKHLVMDPRVCFGKLTFKRTRLPVETVLHCLAEGESVDYILTAWPYLSRAAVAEAVTLACEALLERYGSARLGTDEPVHPRRAVDKSEDIAAACMQAIAR